MSVSGFLELGAEFQVASYPRVSTYPLGVVSHQSPPGQEDCWFVSLAPNLRVYCVGE